jgi:hypothetical protein
VTTIINLYGGPGSGKSTTAAHLFALMKLDHMNVELVTEYAKDKVWEGSNHVLRDQLYVFAKQHNRLFRLIDKVDYVITDAPLLLSIHYGAYLGYTFENLVLSMYHSMRNRNYFIRRVKPYSSHGRTQKTVDEAIQIDNAIKTILSANHIGYGLVDGDENAASIILRGVKLDTPRF